MSRHKPTSLVTPNMYRNFAVAALGITVCLAMFADNDSRDEIENSIAETQQQNQLKQQEKRLANNSQDGAGKKVLLNDKRTLKGSFGPGTDDLAIGLDREDLDGEMAPPRLAATTYGGISAFSAEMPVTAAPPGMTASGMLSLDRSRKSATRTRRQLAPDESAKFSLGDIK